ncbi:DNA-3-methyladenine glycosylase I [Photobacterium phosphoreum]|jgi:DNA-3-methyladenine glycosylase I|uniref:DNA-3-methyladenine glycosylase I n=2 Tax=Photobacterium phosphoreum TaxID=659 RepID=A0AAW4ZX15_PHOPO|nr:DNA-3-methyladenine glycosylase I [Photobacterium phosphoreum]MCD9482191.1 DNA-3-methyladenine glycosylase I [Photobacterium phosphoreum]MCD9491543.1 DNA-3-methyladenine glycosylase I [Photobacterium phosphoreum]MCD9503377.1 DNA-3-methyladenine glycosylase I [Photobacterium phosphoreum]MCD9505811.1 DNA-3-methyladenine glycosylase I [Photobacterium phosphoreum]MCF2190809.1 DNA-3-methyladenine glycosylase I [Photobacterium phosphoreum]
MVGIVIKYLNNLCSWALHSDLERQYHDNEWGIPHKNDDYLFEFLTLEGAQAGLNWYTILKKRASYSDAFESYNIDKLAAYNEQEIELRITEIIEHYDVVRHRGKLRSVFTNARAAKALQIQYGSLAAPLWQFVNNKPQINHWLSKDQVPVTTSVSLALSQYLKQQGFKFIGNITCYAFMQAVGMVNDHTINCHCYHSIANNKIK